MLLVCLFKESASCDGICKSPDKLCGIECLPESQKCLKPICSGHFNKKNLSHLCEEKPGEFTCKKSGELCKGLSVKCAGVDGEYVLCTNKDGITCIPAGQECKGECGDYSQRKCKGKCLNMFESCDGKINFYIWSGFFISINCGNNCLYI